MDQVETLRIESGAWQTENTNWEGILKNDGPPLGQIIFTSARTIENAPQVLRAGIFKRFKIAPFLFNRVYLESNGFSGCESMHDENRSLISYNHWSRFIVKQTHTELRPKSSFTRHYSFGEISPLSKSNAPIHGPGSVKHGWEWYEMGFFVHWTPPCSTTLLCFDLPEHMKASFQSALQSVTEKSDLIDPYAVFGTVIHEILSLYNDSVWSLRNHICSMEAVRPQEPNYPYLHEIARHAIHVSETLSVALESINALQMQHQDYAVQYSQDSNRWNKIYNQFQFQRRVLHGLLLRSESNKARIQNEITLAFNTAAQRDSSIQVRIGEEAKKETSAMKAIAVVTMTFLPATFVASIFSTSFFHFEPSVRGSKETFVVSDKFWMYWVLAAPLSVAALGLWMFWDRMLGKKH
ncbi:hypothetical protein BKA66DRAFT_476291 [Pyrenochaeta sp. MPI-SDFR-AT-0127]|nr:hypothetical protein BKA66DRAFT_476291 [Pyrenochaeta sp. MPI-SDFR-AT-0127]